MSCDDFSRLLMLMLMLEGVAAAHPVYRDDAEAQVGVTLQLAAVAAVLLDADGTYRHLVCAALHHRHHQKHQHRH
jgi:hypothetical protein